MIPQITDPLGRYWDQPPLIDVAVYNDIAIMDRKTFNRLADYSHSVPTGTYEGKMWKCKERGTKVKESGWLLRWYSQSCDPKLITMNTRPIRILKELSA